MRCSSRLSRARKIGIGRALARLDRDRVRARRHRVRPRRRNRRRHATPTPRLHRRLTGDQFDGVVGRGGRPISAAISWNGSATSRATASTACSGPIPAAAAPPRARKRRATGPGSRATGTLRRTARSAISSATPGRPGAAWPGSARGWRRASISASPSTRAASAIDIPLALQSATIDLTQIGFTASVDSGPWTWASAVVHGFGNINSRRDTGLGIRDRRLQREARRRAERDQLLLDQGPEPHRAQGRVRICPRPDRLAAGDRRP